MQDVDVGEHWSPAALLLTEPMDCIQSLDRWDDVPDHDHCLSAIRELPLIDYARM
jgi:hypothetical protein